MGFGLLSETERAGLLVAVISGGRPMLRERPTARLLSACRERGFKTCWIVSDHEAAGYEPDITPLVSYSREWAVDYAASHWLEPGRPEPDSFLGAFPGREAACREAERRGCWGVLQLDDNIQRITINEGGGGNIVDRLGGLALFADMLGAAVLATNGRMVGAQLGSVPPEAAWIRSGFPYSLFVEKVGAGREEWFGPFEDDIMHALQYGNRAESGTAVVMPLLRYAKEFRSASGMRSHYQHQRSKALARIAPEVARSTVMRAKSNGAGGPRIFHKLAAGAIRTPVLVTDRARFNALAAANIALSREWKADYSARKHRKIRRYAGLEN